MKRRFRNFRDDRFALTTLQNPNLEVRTYSELVQAAERERKIQQAAAPIPATQAPAIPSAPDPDPPPATPAPIVSAPPDSANPDSASEETNDEAQQLLDSVVASVITAGSSLPTLPSLCSPSSLTDESTTHPTPKPRRKSKPKTKSRRKSKPRQSPALARAQAWLSATDNNNATATQGGQPDENQVPEQDESTGPTPLERHARKCSICRHPERQQIDESFLHWRSPQTIMHCFGIKTETTIYHHAHAFNLFALRNRNLQSALCNIIEDIDTRDFTGREILDAVRALAHLTADGRWIHHTSKSEVMYSMQRLPAVAGLPAVAELPTAHAALPAHSNGDEILIASPPSIKKRCNPLKTILSYSG
jgi:hypothetical protein